MPRAPSLPEDELEDLPPLDGDTEEALEPDLEIDEDEVGGGGGLDDTTAENDPVDAGDLEIDGAESTWLNEAGDSADLDVGESDALELREDDAIAADDEAAAPGAATGEDYGFDESADRAVLDGGDEGPLDADEELRDEDLPSLDADEEGEGSDATFWEGRLAAEESGAYAWAAKPWARVGAPLGLVQARAIACVARGALVAARTEAGVVEIVRVDLEGLVESRPAPGIEPGSVRRFAADGADVAMVLDGGGLYLGGAEPRVIFEGIAPGVSIADVVLAGGTIWARTTSGALLASRDRGRNFSRCPVPGTVAAIARDGALGIAALAVDDTRQPVGLVRGPAPGVNEKVATVATVREPSETTGPVGTPSVFAARAGAVAYVARTGRLVRRGVDGTWSTFEWEGKITALSFVDDVGTLLAATYSDTDEATALVRLDRSGRPALVARLGPSVDHADSDGQAVALACDDSRGVVWIAGGFGVAAFAIASE
jgi:hypothetical protein